MGESGQNLDFDLVLAGAELALEVLKKQKKGHLVPYYLFEILYLKTRERIASGEDLASARFSLAEIAYWLKETGKTSSSLEEPAAFTRTHFNSLSKLLDQYQEQLEEEARLAGHEFRVVVSKTDSKGGSGNTADLYLDVVRLEKSEHATEEAVADNRQVVIEYQAKQLPKPYPWSQPFLELDLDQSGLVRFLVPLLTIVAVLALGGVWLVLSALAEGHYAAAIVLTVVGVLIASFFKPFYLLVEKGVAIAPSWMVNWGVLSAVLELRPTGKVREDGRPLRQIRLVTYRGDCPVCSGDVYLDSGSGPDRWRVVGACRNAPGEHLFSFDHMTKRGVPLRSNGYYGED